MSTRVERFWSKRSLEAREVWTSEVGTEVEMEVWDCPYSETSTVETAVDSYSDEGGRGFEFEFDASCSTDDETSCWMGCSLDPDSKADPSPGTKEGTSGLR